VASSASVVEVVGARDFTTEGSATLTSVASSSSLESLMMMILPSPGGPRSLQLRSPKSFLANSLFYVMSGMRSSSSEERCTTGILSEGPSCSKTDEQWRREETSDGDPGGDGEPDGVEALLDDKEPSLEGERGRLVPLLSSIVVKRRMREENPKRKVKE
jgi:hypothetical protein